MRRRWSEAEKQVREINRKTEKQGKTQEGGEG